MILAWMSDIYEFFQADHTFYKLYVKIVTANNKLGVCVCVAPVHQLIISFILIQVIFFSREVIFANFTNFGQLAKTNSRKIFS